MNDTAFLIMLAATSLPACGKAEKAAAPGEPVAHAVESALAAQVR